MLRRENERLRVEVQSLVLERRELELKVKVLQQQLWGRKSERHVPAGAGAGEQAELFCDPAPPPPAVVPPAPSRRRARGRRERRALVNAD